MLADSPWPKFKCDLGNTGLSPYPLLDNGGKEAWCFEFGGGKRVMPGSPVIGPDDTIFVSVTRDSSVRTDVFAVNSDGSLRWKTTLDLWAHGPEAVDAEGCLYLPCRGQDDKVRALVAINPDGSERWRTPLPHFNFTGCTIASDGIYLGAGRQAVCYGFDGELKWKTRVGVDVGDNSVSPALTLNGTLLFTTILMEPMRSSRATLVALTPEGQLAWKKEFGTCRFTKQAARIHGYPVALPDGRICVNVEHHTLEDVGPTAILHSAEGAELARLPANVDGVGADGTLFAFAPTGSRSATRLYMGRYDDFVDLPAATGWKLQRLTADLQTMWERPVGTGTTIAATSADGFALVRTESHALRAISPEGDLRWTLWDRKTWFLDAIIGRNGTVYATTTQGMPSLRAIV